jgi:RNA polymerase sigma factor (sigma-70 family)
MDGLSRTINQILRQDRGRLMSALIGKFRNFDLAEDALQEALESAAVHWARSGLPASPAAWLYTAASRKAIDHIRKNTRNHQLVDELTKVMPMSHQQELAVDEFPDNRLRLIFTCCHPALEQKSQVALTLRTLGGLTTTEIARAFLDNETTLGQRLSRAKAKIAKANIPYVVPERDAWDERLSAVLTVIYLIFNEGYFASSGEIPLRRALCDEAIFLGQMLATLKPDEPEVLGLLALMLFTHARHRARVQGAGVVPLEAQNAILWDREKLAQAHSHLDHALALARPGPYQIQAAIAALHCQVGAKDWQQIALLYRALKTMDPNPVVTVNFAVALAQAGSVSAGLFELEAVGEDLVDYQPFYAAYADLLRQAGRVAEAERAYDRAIALALNEADAQFLQTARQNMSEYRGSTTQH